MTVTQSELQSLLTAFVKEGGYKGDDDWKKIPRAAYQGPPLVICLREDIIRILERYLAREYSAEDTDSWASEIETCYARDLIDYEPGYRGIIFEIIEFLDVAGEDDLTPEIARQFIYQLQTSEFRPNDEP